MRVMVIEDDGNKRTQLVEFVTALIPDATVLEAMSYRSGVKGIVDNRPDIVVLDMSMPTFDIAPGESGGRPRTYAGRDVLDEISRRDIQTRVVIVTQFDGFGESSDRKTLEQLNKELQKDFPELYLGCVYYHRAQSAWRIKLTSILIGAIKGVTGTTDSDSRR